MNWRMFLSFLERRRRTICLWQQSALIWPFTYLSDRRKVFWLSRFTNCIISYQDIKPNVMEDDSTFWEWLASVSKGDMWHDLSGDRIFHAHFLLFCQYLLPMGNYFQIIFLWTLETRDITETQITFSGARSLSLSQPTESERPSDQTLPFQISDRCMIPIRLQLYTDHFEQ
jgi:hypothetical protein